MKIPNVTIQQLLEAGVHLGHKTLRWNPKMKKYIFGKRDSIHIIDLTQTLELTNVALEKVYNTIINNGKIKPWSGFTDLFITPGFKFKIVNLLITNFHLPKSTLLMLVSAFHGRDNIFKKYQYAITQKYRFFSYGDSCIFSRDNND